MSTAAAPSSAPDDSATLLFGDGRGTRSRWRLGLLIFGSLLAHAATFYIFQVAYTPTGSLLPPPARVMLVPLNQPENASLARWLALADPTLATQSPLPEAASVVDALGFRYVPSYDATPPAFKPLETVGPAEGVAPPPRPMPPGPVAMNLTPGTRTSASTDGKRSSGPAPTRVFFSGGIEAYVPETLPPIHYAGSAGVKPLEPTAFLVGLRAEGGTPFLFPVRQAPASNASANADEADEFGRDYLARLTFHPAPRADGGTLWGRATFYWGGDARRPAKSP